jgi:UDP-N-acetylmuramoyl-L-alanyl-D-glutamate--2,6-diaminopimelate ligase
LRFHELAAALDHCEAIASGDAEITGVTSDSRAVRSGVLFVAYRGVAVDGHRFIADALARGAAAVVAERAEALAALPAGVPGVAIGDGRAALARLAAAYHGFPSRHLRVVGVTGTDGKTTTSSIVLAILRAADRSAGAITTVSATIGGRDLDTGFHTTTPDSVAVQSYLAQMVAARAEYAVVETTSHGLDQGRVFDVDYDVAAYTNVTAEHLDYHGTFESYRATKARLFAMLGSSYRKPGVPKIAVLNADDPSVEVMREPLRRRPVDRMFTYGIDAPADFQATDLRLAASGTRFRAETPAGTVEIETPLLGRYNVSNALAAIAIGVSQDIPLATIARALAGFGGIKGRMEPIDAGQPFKVIVDFAHTPNSLQNALAVARGLTTGRVISVFGCAGLRDRVKRPAMGEIAGRLADLVVLTAEDPRTESLDAINAEIGAGCERAGRRLGVDYWSVPDREAAIGFAVERARPGDVVIITGKGHEQSLCFGTTEVPWSDHEAARRQIQGLRG